MNILLAKPRSADTPASPGHILRSVGKLAALPPLGLLTVAAMLPRQWPLRLVDLGVRDLTDEHLHWADAVLVSATIAQEKSAHAVVRRARTMGKTVVICGPLVTPGVERFPEADAGVIGEDRETIEELAADLEAGSLRRTYEPAGRRDPDRAPSPRWDLIDVNEYLVMAMRCSHAQPVGCDTDDDDENGHAPRAKTPGQIAAELDAVLAAGWAGPVFIVDGDFVRDRVTAKQTLRTIIDWRSARRAHNTFITEASVTMVDDEEMLSLMTRAGFGHVFISIEPPPETGIRASAKAQHAKQRLRDAVRAIHRAGIEVMAGCTVAFDAERDDAPAAKQRPGPSRFSLASETSIEMSLAVSALIAGVRPAHR